jgi:hypothetical protein
METSDQVNEHDQHHARRRTPERLPDGAAAPGRARTGAHQGWGADLDRKNRPGVPMERTPPRFIHQHEGKLPQQPENVEVLVSTERDGITPSSAPPSRPRACRACCAAAFKWSENDMRHWLILLAPTASTWSKASAKTWPRQGAERAGRDGHQGRVGAQQGRAGEEGRDCRGRDRHGGVT